MRISKIKQRRIGQSSKRQDHHVKTNCEKKNRSLGKQYTTTTGKCQTARCVGPNPCRKCPFACGKWTEESREAIFGKYWSMGSHERQMDWIVGRVNKLPVKRRRQSAEENRRQYTYQYCFPQQGRKVQVCKQLFLFTLDISEKNCLLCSSACTAGCSQN